MKALENYILDAQGNPVIEPDWMRWAEWYGSRGQRTDWIVGKTKVGDAEISTVFLAIDHSFDSIPVLWETLVFGGLLDNVMERYTSRADAERGHTAMVERIRASRQARVAIDRARVQEEESR